MKRKLLNFARKSANNSFCHYSLFPVGAAVRCGDKIITGCNIENASYGLTMCAERVAIFNAISQGYKMIDEIAVSCVNVVNNKNIKLKMPCGACRQVIAEFANEDCQIHIDGDKTYLLKDLLPLSFSLK